MWLLFCFFKQKTAYEMRISDWSSDVCSSDLLETAIVCKVQLMILDRLDGLRRSVVGGECEGCVRRLGIADASGDAIVRAVFDARKPRSEERRVGKECVSTCRSRWSPYNEKKKQNIDNNIKEKLTELDIKQLTH